MKTYKDYIAEASLTKVGKRFMDTRDCILYYNNIRKPSATYISRNKDRVYNIGVDALGAIELYVICNKDNTKDIDIKTNKEMKWTLSMGDVIGVGEIKKRSISSFSDIKPTMRDRSFGNDLKKLIYYMKLDNVTPKDINDMITALFDEYKKNMAGYEERKKQAGDMLDKAFRDFHP